MGQIHDENDQICDKLYIEIMNPELIQILFVNLYPINYILNKIKSKKEKRLWVNKSM